MRVLLVGYAGRLRPDLDSRNVRPVGPGRNGPRVLDCGGLAAAFPGARHGAPACGRPFEAKRWRCRRSPQARWTMDDVKRVAGTHGRDRIVFGKACRENKKPGDTIKDGSTLRLRLNNGPSYTCLFVESVPFSLVVARPSGPVEGSRPLREGANRNAETASSDGLRACVIVSWAGYARPRRGRPRRPLRTFRPASGVRG